LQDWSHPWRCHAQYGTRYLLRVVENAHGLKLFFFDISRIFCVFFIRYTGDFYADFVK
jgi:hypothetical protein